MYQGAKDEKVVYTWKLWRKSVNSSGRGYSGSSMDIKEFFFSKLLTSFF